VLIKCQISWFSSCQYLKYASLTLLLAQHHCVFCSKKVYIIYNTVISVFFLKIFGSVNINFSFAWILEISWPLCDCSYKAVFFFVFVATAPVDQGCLIHEVSRSHTQRRTTVGRTLRDAWSVRRRDLYLTTHNTHNGQTFMPPVLFEPTISAGERPQTHTFTKESD